MIAFHWLMPSSQLLINLILGFCLTQFLYMNKFRIACLRCAFHRFIRTLCIVSYVPHIKRWKQHNPTKTIKFINQAKGGRVSLYPWVISFLGHGYRLNHTHIKKEKKLRMRWSWHGLSIINFHLRKTMHSHPLSAITHWRHLTNDQWEITPNIL